MNYSFIKEIVDDVSGHVQDRKATFDSDDRVLKTIDLLDNSMGLMEVRYVACCLDDTTPVGISGIKQVVFSKVGGVVSLTETDIYLGEGSGVMGDSALRCEANDSGGIDIIVNGAGEPDDPIQVNWHITTIINRAQAPEIET